MTVKHVYLLLVVLFSSSFLVLSKVDSPEMLLAGTWEEVEWEFEKVNYSEDRKELVVTGEQKREICSNLIIHNEPIWRFSNNDRLLTIGEENKKSAEILSWNVKGRGHILELKGPKGTEDYQIAELTDDKLVLYFNFDLQIRGIIKMTFKRIS